MVKMLCTDSSILLLISLILIITIFVLNSIAFDNTQWFDQHYRIKPG